MKSLKRISWFVFAFIFITAVTVWGVACNDSSKTASSTPSSSSLLESPASNSIVSDTEFVSTDTASLEEVSSASVTESVDTASSVESSLDSTSQSSLEMSSSVEIQSSLESSPEDISQTDSSLDVSTESASSEEESQSSEIESSDTPLAHEHVWNEGTIVKFATCTEKGEKSFACIVDGCMETKTEECQETEKDNGHLYVTVDGKESTCTSTGLTEGIQCSRCNEWSKQQEVTVIKPHEYVDNVCKGCDLAQLKYEIKSGYAVCKGFVSEDMIAETVVIADTYRGFPVISIEGRAFADCWFIYRLTLGVNIGSTVTVDSTTYVGEIENAAFDNCYNLTEIYNQSKLELRKGSLFDGEVAHYAKEIYTSPQESKVSTDSNGFVYYTNGADKILIAYTGTEKTIEIPSGVTEISSYAFNNANNLEEITMADSVAKICDYAFADCASLSRVEFGNGVCVIRAFIFLNTEIEKVGFKVKDTWWRVDATNSFDPNQEDKERIQIRSEAAMAEEMTFKGDKESGLEANDNKHYYRT